jgi:PAS domain S-box-containing protein
MDGIVGYDTNLEIFAWNPTMERLTGIPKESVMGKSILVLFPPSKVIEGEKRERREKY